MLLFTSAAAAPAAAASAAAASDSAAGDILCFYCLFSTAARELGQQERREKRNIIEHTHKYARPHRCSFTLSVQQQLAPHYFPLLSKQPTLLLLHHLVFTTTTAATTPLPLLRLRYTRESPLWLLLNDCPQIRQQDAAAAADDDRSKEISSQY